MAGLPLLPRSGAPTYHSVESKRAAEMLDSSVLKRGSAAAATGEVVTGEDILLAKLRKTYKKNLDLVEAYCARNVFTIEYFPKTKRRKVLDHFLGGGGEKDDEGSKEGGDGSLESAPKEGDTNNDTLPTSKYNPPSKNLTLPTPQQLQAMDAEILLTRQRVHQEKQRRVKLVRELERLRRASESLRGVQSALLECNVAQSSGDNGEVTTTTTTTTVSVQQLQEKVRSALQGHEELKVWNSRAEEVIKMLDTIKEERGEDGVIVAAGDASGKVARKKKNAVVAREVDERERRRVMLDMNGGEEGGSGGGAHGTKKEIASLLKKIREG